MKELKIAVLGDEKDTQSRLIKNLAENSTRVNFQGMKSGIDIGYTISNGKKVFLFGAEATERKRFFEEVLPAGIDLGIVVVDSKNGISNKDKETIKEVKEKKVPCMVFFNDKREHEIQSFGENVLQGSAENRASTNRLMDYLTRMS